MARIRSIKPEFWSSEQVMECSPIARLLFIGIWNFADDTGRIPFSAKTIKAQVFPGDDITSETVRGMIDELSSKGLLLPYSVDGKEYLLVTGWHHQKIDKPQKPKYPPPPPDHSPNIPRTLATDLNTEGIGKDRNHIPSPAVAGLTKYAFESGIIRLNQRDYDRWKTSFSHIDLDAELVAMTPWAEQQGKNWFHALPNALRNKNQQAKERKEQAAKQGDFKWNSGMEGII